MGIRRLHNSRTLFLIWWSIRELCVIILFHSMIHSVVFLFLFWQQKSSLQKVKTNRKAEQYQNNSHLSCFEKWLKIFCKVSAWSAVSPLLLLLLLPTLIVMRVCVCELSEAKTEKHQSLSRFIPMGQSHHWNRIAFIPSTNWKRT